MATSHSTDPKEEKKTEPFKSIQDFIDRCQADATLANTKKFYQRPFDLYDGPRGEYALKLSAKIHELKTDFHHPQRHQLETLYDVIHDMVHKDLSQAMPTLRDADKSQCQNYQTFKEDFKRGYVFRSVNLAYSADKGLAPPYETRFLQMMTSYVLKYSNKECANTAFESLKGEEKTNEELARQSNKEQCVNTVFDRLNNEEKVIAELARRLSSNKEYDPLIKQIDKTMVKLTDSEQDLLKGGCLNDEDLKKTTVHVLREAEKRVYLEKSLAVVDGLEKKLHAHKTVTAKKENEPSLVELLKEKANSINQQTLPQFQIISKLATNVLTMLNDYQNTGFKFTKSKTSVGFVNLILDTLTKAIANVDGKDPNSCHEQMMKVIKFLHFATEKLKHGGNLTTGINDLLNDHYKDELRRVMNKEERMSVYRSPSPQEETKADVAPPSPKM